jgi:hypothetical protein
MARQDQLFSPMVHRGWTMPAIRLEWHRGSAQWRHQLGLGYQGFSLRAFDPFTFVDPSDGSTVTTASTSITALELDQGLQRLLYQGERGSWWGGLGLGARIEAIQHGYAYPTFGYLSLFGLEAQARYEHSFNQRWRMTMTAAVPVLAWVARSPYLLNDDRFIENQRSHRTLPTLWEFIEDGSMRSLGGIRRIRMAAELESALGQRWALALTIEIEALECPEPVRVISYRQALSLGITYLLQRP